MKTSDMLLLGAGLGVAAYFLVYKPINQAQQTVQQITNLPATTTGAVTGAVLGAEQGAGNIVQNVVQQAQLAIGAVLTPDQPIVIGKTGIEPSTQTNVWDKATDYISSTVLPSPEVKQPVWEAIKETVQTTTPTVPRIAEGDYGQNVIHKLFTFPYASAHKQSTFYVTQGGYNYKILHEEGGHFYVSWL